MTVKRRGEPWNDIKEVRWGVKEGFFLGMDRGRGKGGFWENGKAWKRAGSRSGAVLFWHHLG